jgi:hypothetical protein
MKRRLTVFSACLLGLMMWASAAQASMFNFAYTGSGGVTATGTLDVSGGLATNGSITVVGTSADGTYSLIPTSTPGSGAFTYDNQVTTGTPNLTNGGLLFGNPGSQEFNIWYSGPDYGLWGYSGIYPTGPGFSPQSYGSFTLTAVPIPPAVLLLASGLISFFGFARRKVA